MVQYRHNLPQLSNKDLFITDAGLETILIFRDGIDMPDFAAFNLLEQHVGYQALWNYFHTYVEMAGRYGVGLVLESPTWRANPDWGKRLGYSSATLAEMNHKAIALLHDIRQRYETEVSRMVISGCIGPRGDGYVATSAMTAYQAQDYHQAQIATFCDADADLVTAMTINYAEEAIGIVHAAQTMEMPVVISFTVETDGRLPSGQPLKEAIAQVDATTHNGPAYYMINCAHPTHFADVLVQGEPWLERIRGIRANASSKSHAELNESETLDAGDPQDLGAHYRRLRQQFPHITVLGGCCGTDERHIEAICNACLPVAWAHLSQGQLVGLG